MTSTDRGASLISAIVAMFLMTTAAGLAARLVRSAVTVTDRCMATLTRTAALARFDANIIGVLSRVRQPPWLPAPAVRIADGRIALQYLDGDPGREVHIGWSGGGAFITSAGETTNFPAVSIRGARLAHDPPARLLISVEGPDGSPLLVAAPLGAAPLPRQ